MANTPYDNFFLSNEVEDQYNSHLALLQFCTVDNSLVGTPGMIRKINRYSATSGTQKLAKGAGNTQTIEASYTQVDYTIQLAQNRFSYFDEDEMTDPVVVLTGTKRLGSDMFNFVNGEIYDEFNKGSMITVGTKFDFDMFANAQAMLGLENLEGTSLFAFVHPSDVAALRKEVKDSLQYVEAFARQGYIGTIAGVNIYTKKDAIVGTIVMATKEAVTMFNKKGVVIEQEREINTRENTVYSKKYYLAALTDDTKLVKLFKGAATLSTDTTVDADKTYYAVDGLGYIAVTPESGDNPTTKGWYEIA